MPGETEIIEIGERATTHVSDVHASSSLRYRLLDGIVDLAPLRIMQRCDLSWETSRVSMYILGASHAMELSHSGRRITEMLTCSAAPGRDTAIVEASVDSACAVEPQVAGLCWSTRLSRHPLDEFDAHVAGLPGADRMRQLFVHPESGAESWTVLGWQIGKDELRLVSLHTYVQDRVCIRSDTRVARSYESIKEPTS